ncbi:hypothetical protein [Enterococcus termitis]|uniref:Uncharacterized protein n=1 Tax=Enterococcus termitis TaxID=332950 RepID=A0A1E5H161_9ENTE|nr:hypothetical protein [Enterococcus termitis]OEG18661.1 hypothetical protein BCR25_15785 [Enterococcus termitis]OJG97616.1 hypothetical protein RV18_GL000684 [Enterococcus termitis]
MMIFIAGMMFGSFGGVLIMLFVQGAYNGDAEWKIECDKEFMNQDRERSALRSQSRSKGNK